MSFIPEEYRHDLAIIRETSLQIIKDFNIDGFDINFSGIPHLAFDELKSQVIPQLHGLMKGEKSAFLALLYRVDVSEKEYRDTLNESDAGTFEENLAEVIIRREFKKVLIRKYHSGM